MISKEKQKLGYIEGWLSAVLNIILFVLQLWAGIVIGSVAMIASAWHTLSDTLTSVIVLFGFYIAGKPKDKEHPFGHGRAELVCAMIIGTLLGVVGFNFLKESYLQIINHKAVEFKGIGILIFGISALVKEGLAQFSIWAGKKINSKALTADGWHHRSDAIASLLIVIGAILGRYFWWVDGVLGIIVSLLILYAAYDTIKNTADSLLGKNIDEELVEKITKTLNKIATGMISDAHHFHIHRYGDHEEVTLHLKMPGEYSLHQAHELASKVENELRNRFNLEPTIHFEPLSDITSS